MITFHSKDIAKLDILHALPSFTPYGLVKLHKNLIFRMDNFVRSLNKRVAEGDASDPHDFIIEPSSPYII